jgi:RNA polymerase sigma-70 factor (ECF subfamily)
MTVFEKKFEERTGENFNNYYKQYKPKLTWYLTRYTKDIEMAEEFANMAFIQGLEKIDTYNSEISQFITWLTTIAINLVIKDYKDKQRNRHVSIDKEISNNLTLNTFLKHEDNSEEDEIQKENKIKSDIIKDVIYSLPDKYKKVMIMRELDRKPYKDIAKEITKEYNFIIDSTYDLKINEYFHSVTISNLGDNDIEINYINNNIIIEPNENKIIESNNINDIINIKPNKSKTNIKIIESTNLSTIKSQIKKGRFLIRKKVKRKFDLINKHGI